MRLAKIGIGLAAATLGTSTMASAQSLAGFYIGAGAGVNLVEETTGYSNRSLAAQLRA